MKAACLGALFALWPMLVCAADISPALVDVGGVPVPVLRLKGSIQPGDLAVLKGQFLFQTVPLLAPALREHAAIELDSGGGEVGEAVKIGRWMRENDLLAVVKPDAVCASACVMVLAGASKRVVEGRVGIHRIMIVRTDRDVGETAKANLEGARSYFVEMNVPGEIADIAASTPVDEIDVLDADRLHGFRLDQDDYVFDEAWTLAAAARAGMPAPTFRSALAKADADAQAACRPATDGSASVACLSRFYAGHPLTKSLDHPRFHFVGTSLWRLAAMAGLILSLVAIVLVSVFATLCAPFRPAAWRPRERRSRALAACAMSASVLMLGGAILGFLDVGWLALDAHAFFGLTVLAALLAMRGLFFWRGLRAKLLAMPALLFWTGLGVLTLLLP